MPLAKRVTKPGVPYHVGIVMDGNGRWAKAHGKPRLEGHKRGAEVARSVVEWAKELGIRQLSLFAFSTENWRRPELEVRGLMSLLAVVLPRSTPDMMANGVRLQVLGDISPLPRSAKKAVESAISETADNCELDLILCLNYGGQQEIIAGVKEAVRHCIDQDDAEKRLAELTPDGFRKLLWRRDLAPVDLLIRTGGEHRISNFHIWDAAYAELYFSDTFWPDFSRDELKVALDDYAVRERRYGKTSEQVDK